MTLSIESTIQNHLYIKYTYLVSVSYQISFMRTLCANRITRKYSQLIRYTLIRAKPCTIRLINCSTRSSPSRTNTIMTVWRCKGKFHVVLEQIGRTALKSSIYTRSNYA